MLCMEGVEGIIVRDSVSELDVDGGGQPGFHEFQIDQKATRSTVAVDERMNALEGNMEPCLLRDDMS